MDNCPSYNLALSNILEHFLGLLHVWAEQWDVMLNVHIEEISTQSVPKITRLVGGDKGERDEEGDDGLAEVPPRRHPDQRRQRQEVHQRHVRLERPL